MSCLLLQCTRRHSQHHRRRSADRREHPPCPGPTMRHAGRRLQHRWHQQRRQQDAEAGTAVVEAEQQAGACRMLGAEPCRQQPAGHEDPGAGHASKPALQQKGGCRFDEATCGHEDARQHRAPHQQARGSETSHQARHRQRAHQIAEGIGRVHATRQRIAPAQVGTHRRQQQAVSEARDAERHRRTHRERKRHPKRVRRHRWQVG